VYSRARGQLGIEKVSNWGSETVTVEQLGSGAVNLWSSQAVEHCDNGTLRRGGSCQCRSAEVGH
jgi:hypothetical protein